MEGTLIIFYLNSLTLYLCSKLFHIYFFISSLCDKIIFYHHQNLCFCTKGHFILLIVMNHFMRYEYILTYTFLNIYTYVNHIFFLFLPY